MTYPNDIQVALQIVRQAALLARRIQAEMISPRRVEFSLRRVEFSPAISKTDRSPVTVADFAIQALVARRLMEAFPADLLVAEEDSSLLRDSPLLDQVTGFVSGLLPDAVLGVKACKGERSSPERPITPQAVCDWIDRGRATTPAATRYWLLDPIDGTKGFLRGGQGPGRGGQGPGRGGQYAVALALMVDGQAQIGVLGCPELTMDMVGMGGGRENHSPQTRRVDNTRGCLAYAVRGQGAWLVPLEVSEPTVDMDAQGTSGVRRDAKSCVSTNSVRLQVSPCADPAQARLLRSFEAGHTNVEQIEQFAAVLGVQAEPVLMDSQVKYAVLAAGQGDLILRLLSVDQPNYREKAWDQAAGSLVVEEAGGRATDLDGRPFDFSAGRELVRNRGVLVSNGFLHAAALQALKAIGA